MKYSKAHIEAMLPHSGNMVLLESVERFDTTAIRCTAVSHQDPSNPLMVGAKLCVYTGVEYAAQAMALHNRLSIKEEHAGAVREGVVAVASKLHAHVQRLDGLDGPVVVDVSVLDTTGDSSLYEFALACAAKPLLTGRLLVMLT